MDLNIEKKIEKISLLFRIHDYEQAERVLRSLFREHPGIAKEQNLDVLLAISLYKQNKLDATLQTLKTAVQDNTSSMELNLSLAVCLCDLGQYEEASKIFATAKNLGFSMYKTSLEAEFHRRSAELLRFLGHPGNSLVEWAQSTVVDSASLNTELQIANTYLENKKYSEAVEYLKKLVKKYPSSITTRTLLGIAYFSKSESSEARQVWKDALELNPKAREPKILLDSLEYAS